MLITGNELNFLNAPLSSQHILSRSLYRIAVREYHKHSWLTLTSQLGMATGDLDGNLERLKSELRRTRFAGELDEPG